MLIYQLYEQIRTFNSKDTCPSCGVKLPKIPKRKSTCKSCDNAIFVSTSIPNGATILLNSTQKGLYNKFSAIYDQVKCKHAPLIYDDFIFSANDINHAKNREECNHAWSIVNHASAYSFINQDWIAMLYYQWQQFFFSFKECRFKDSARFIPTILALSRICSYGMAEEHLSLTNAPNSLEVGAAPMLSVGNIWSIFAVFDSLDEIGELLLTSTNEYYLQILYRTNQTQGDVLQWFIKQINRFDLRYMPSSQ